MKTRKTYPENRMKELQELGYHDAVMAFYEQCIAELGSGLSMLDLGAGSGSVSKTLSRNDSICSIVAYDKNMEYMRELDIDEKKKIIKSTGGTTCSLPFNNAQFDLVICRYAFHHFQKKQESFNEIYRILKSTGLFLYSDPVFPDHSKNCLNPIYAIREDHFHGYMGYFDTLASLEKSRFRPVLIRPYKYRVQFVKYLEGVEDGYGYTDSQNISDIFSNTLKTKIQRAWLSLDDQTKNEMKISQEGGFLSFQYNFVDIACMKDN